MKAESPVGQIEIGIVIAGTLDSIDEAALRRGVELVRTRLQTDVSDDSLTFHFRWVTRSELVRDDRVEPSRLLRQAESERDARHWDFAFVVTAAELLGNYSSASCFAALSRPFDAAVFSTSLIDPRASGEQLSGEEATDEQRTEIIAKRLSRLMLHALGHLTGLPSVDEANRIMQRPISLNELDETADWTDSELQRQRVALSEVADQRLEELGHQAMNALEFFVKASWINRSEIVEAVWAARPWQFPRRLSGLTIASVSTAVILLMTAEAWDLALTQSFVSIFALTLTVLLGTTAYVALRQQLLIRSGRTRSEQSVVTSASAVFIVAIGMLTTWVGLTVSGLTVAWLLFSPDLIISWAGSREWEDSVVGAEHRLAMSCFSSSIGLLVGALGTSFESQNYFQHVIFVDEEV